MAIFQPITSMVSNSLDLYKNICKMSDELGISLVTSRILINRGICDPRQAREFLNPSLDALSNPFDIQDMDKAVKRIEQAVKEGQHVTIYGDYDVDGMTASAVLYNFLSKNGCSVDVYLPHRHSEGYGINKSALEAIYEQGTDLIISVDCGITAIEETEYAKELGMDIIITDHHQCGAVLPDAIAVVNPRRNPELYGNYQLAGVGVAGKLVHALGGIKSLEEYLDLICLGTIADVVPLIDENRILVAKGLEKVNKLPCPGIEALIDVSGLGKGKIDTGKVAFGLAPRLNAAGRIAHPKAGFLLLIAKSIDEALPLAHSLEENNRQRQAIESKVIKEAEEMIDDNVDLSTESIIILNNENWDSGVIGIAASKLTEKYNRPCILISVSEEEGTGSARSIEGFDLYKALYSCKELFRRFGGHQQAAGFSILVSNISELRKRLLDYARSNITEEMLVPKYYYDVVLGPSDINYNLIKELEMLQPYGTGNPSPSFLLNDVTIEDSRKVGREGKHLKMSVGLGQRLWDAIAFNTGMQSDLIGPYQRISILTGLEKNEWGGVSKIQFTVQHMEARIDDREDCIDFLKPFYFKFFDAFFASFMYNKKWEKDKWIISGKNAISYDEIIYRFKDSRLGHLFMINTYNCAEKLLIRLAEEGMISDIAIGYGTVNIDKGIGINSCVIAPCFHRIPYSHYKRIYVLENELDFLNGYRLDDWCGNKLFRVIDGQGGDSSECLAAYRVSRTDFVNLYRWLKSLSPGRTLWQNWEELLLDYNKAMQDKINGFQLRLVLAVFEELGFIRISSGYRFVKIECEKQPVHRDLNESNLYCYYKSWMN